MTDLRLDPVLAERLPLIADLPEFGSTAPTPEQTAALISFAAPVGGYVAPPADVSTAVAPGPHGGVPVRVYRPIDGRPPRRGLVWLHGGAFLAGDLDMPESDVVARELVERGGITVVAVDYRLCQRGVHFPVPHDDVHAAFGWACGPDGPLGFGARWALGGASAGGNLAAGVAQRLRDEEGPVPYALVLAYPVTHHPMPHRPADRAAAMARLPEMVRHSPESLRFINENYLGDNPADVPYAFPGLGDVTGLPPTLVTICEYDDLRESGEQFAQSLVEAGVPTRADFVSGMLHGHLNTSGHPAALRTLATMTAFLTTENP